MNKNNWLEIKRRLSFSKFRSKFNLTEKDREYIKRIGLEKIHDHACSKEESSFQLKKLIMLLISLWLGSRKSFENAI